MNDKREFDILVELIRTVAAQEAEKVLDKHLKDHDHEMKTKQRTEG